MDAKRKNEIGDIAKNVSHISEQYQLIHATYACQMLVKQIIMDEYEKSMTNYLSVSKLKYAKG